MLWFKQLELFASDFILRRKEKAPPKRKISGEAVSFPSLFPQNSGELAASPTSESGRDPMLETNARELLRMVGATALIPLVRVEWSHRLRTAAGRADFHRKLITLNPRLRAHGEAEIDRTLRHELAHLVAHSRAGRRRIQPHGPEWRRACSDLGITGEERCHSLPFPVRRRFRPFTYRCPRCAKEFPRVRRIRRAIACLACCRRFNRGHFDKRFQLQLVHTVARE